MELENRGELCSHEFMASKRLTTEAREEGLGEIMDYLRGKMAMEYARIKRRGVCAANCNLPKFTPNKIDWLDLMRTTILIETMLNNGDSGLLFTIAYKTSERVGGCYVNDEFGNEHTDEFFEIWLRTEIARDKLMFHTIGLFKSLKKKEVWLATGKFVTNEREQIYALAALDLARRKSGFIHQVTQEAGKLDPGFFQHMGHLLKRPGRTFAEIKGTNLQEFLLANWATESKDKKGQSIPPLCYCSDPVITELANFGLNSRNTTPYVRKNWERLGLKKAKKIRVWRIKISSSS